MVLREQYKLSVLLKVAKLPKTTYMYHQKMIKDGFNKDKELENLIKEIFLNNKERYGYRRITLVLKSLGHTVNHKKVLRLMRKINIKCTKFGNKSRRYNSFRKNAGNQLPNKINQRFYTNIPRQKITTDTSEFKYSIIDKNGNISIGKLYLDPFMDMFNGEIIAYKDQQFNR